MYIYLEWLKEYVDVPADLDRFCERMVMSGSNIETVERFGEGMKNIVVGRVRSIAKHPDADKLFVCQVDVGRPEPVQIVTGAANVTAGALVPVILPGGVLPGGTEIRAGQLRGVESFGMLCSAKELGYEDKVVPAAHKDGIWILEDDFTPGEDIVEAMGLRGAVVEFEITPNRPDCLSVIGMARETAATFATELRYPPTACERATGSASDHIAVEIRRPDLCSRYTARIVTGVKVGPSPWWLQRRLMHAGMRPINNVVDVTNYVMLEYGQPIHAFDITMLTGGRIVVDTAAEGDTFTTLDGTERRLGYGMLMIRDAERPVAIAGVMGGANSEIRNETETIVIESANFNSDNIRATSKKLGLRTEASARFEKGIDPALTRTAADRVCRMLEAIGAGAVVDGAVDAYPTPEIPVTIPVRLPRIRRLTGVDLEADTVRRILQSLECTWTEEGRDVFLVTPPSVRRDLFTEIDIVEEIARLYGYDRLPLSLPKGSNEAVRSRKHALRDTARNSLIGMGASEIQTYSFVSPRGLDLCRFGSEDKERQTVRLLNPLGEENSIMRTTLLPAMLEALGRNFSRGAAKVRAFEIGNTFFDLTTEEGLPTERESICIATYGADEDFFTVKGLAVQTLEQVGVRELEFVADASIGAFHPGRSARILSRGREIGAIGEIHPDVLETYGIGAKACACVLEFDGVAELADTRRYYSPLPKYPAMARDIALLVEDAVSVADIEERIRAHGTELLERVELFDVYRGKQVPDGKKSVAFALTYRAKDRTLTDQETMEVHGRVLAALRNELNAVLREL